MSSIDEALSLVFWLVACRVLHLELNGFTWKKLWTVRFSLMLVMAGQFISNVSNAQTVDAFAGHLAKLQLVCHPDHSSFDIFSGGYVFFIVCQILMATFAICQFPKQEHLTPLPFDGYQVRSHIQQ